MTRRYLVSWEVDVEADSPEEAARSMYAMMIEPMDTPPCLEVKDPETGESVTIDFEQLLKEDDNE